MKPDVTHQQSDDITIHSDHCVYDYRSSVTVRRFITKQPSVKRIEIVKHPEYLLK